MKMTDGLKQDESTSTRMHDLVTELYPICRSITGEGVRETLRIIQRYIPLTISEVASGTKVFDWTVPPEWNIRDAYIADDYGRRLVDFRQLNLHVMGYSQPIHARMTLGELRPHLFTVPGHDDWIPYRTSYYKENWGFCLSERQLAAFHDSETYNVCIDSTLRPGYLTYGECYLPGHTMDEVLVSCHICHPSLCNDNLSGISIAVQLFRALTTLDRRFSYRLLLIPGTIGSITWLSLNRQLLPRIKHGFVVTGAGDRGDITYKRSRHGNAMIDRAMAHVIRHSNLQHRIIDFFPYGYDERQFCSPGINLPIGCLMRTPHGEYAEYHTSADNLEFVTEESLQQSLSISLAAVRILEKDAVYISLNPYCEPQLGKRGLYKNVGGQKEGAFNEMALLWVLNMSDGQNSLLDIAERADTPFEAIFRAASDLVECGLLAASAEPK
jgi:aminopeptidase-like protein